MASAGITVQVLKHLTGRSTAAANGNKDLWRWFPSPKTYSKSVPSYDAFPSGHLITAMVTTTIISTNYPEYRFIKPVCYSLMGLCGYQMLNNGVHWAGDYPVAIALGYSLGKIAAKRGFQKVTHRKSTVGKTVQPHVYFHPTLLDGGVSGVSMRVEY